MSERREQVWSGFLVVVYGVALISAGYLVEALLAWVSHWLTPGSFGY